MQQVAEALTDASHKRRDVRRKENHGGCLTPLPIAQQVVHYVGWGSPTAAASPFALPLPVLARQKDLPFVALGLGGIQTQAARTRPGHPRGDS